MHIANTLYALTGVFLTIAQAQTLREAIASRDDLTVLLGLLDDNADLAANIAALPNLTIFAPADSASNFNAVRYTEGWAQSFEAELRYHILDGRLITSDEITTSERFYPTLASPQSLNGDLELSLEPPLNRTLGEGTRLLVVEQDGGVFVGRDPGSGANVLTADLEYNNGVIHTIDSLLFSPFKVTTTLVSELNSEPFSRAITNVTGLEDFLLGATVRPFTVFAPNEAAFEALGDALEGVSDEQFARIVEYHIVGGPQPLFDYDLGDGMTLQTLSIGGQGGNLTVTVTEDEVFINQARIVGTNVLHENGLIHILDAFLDPDNSDSPDTDSDEPFIADFETEAPEDYAPPNETATSILEASMTSSVASDMTNEATSTSVPAWTATSPEEAEETGSGGPDEQAGGDDEESDDDAPVAASGGSSVSWNSFVLALGLGGLIWVA